MRSLQFLFVSVSLLGGCAADVAPGEDLAHGDASGGKADLIEVAGELSASLPILGNPEIVFHAAPGLAAVQPTATIKFTYSSCAGRRFDVKRELASTLGGDRVLLQVEDATQIDCFGPTIERNYELQISSDAFADRNFVLLNPSALSFAHERAPECAPVLCALFCENGFAKGDDGCEVCRCAE